MKIRISHKELDCEDKDVIRNYTMNIRISHKELDCEDKDVIRN